MKKVFSGLIVLLLLVMADVSYCRTDYDYIDITNPFLRKIPMAVPSFKGSSATAEEQEVASRGAELLARTLAFTGYFKMLDRKAFLADPNHPNVIVPNIKFKNWTTVGAELLVTGQLAVTGDKLEIELYLYDTFKENLMVGRRYKGQTKHLRKMIRKFCGEVMFKLIGKRGLFDSEIAFISDGSGNKEIYICDFDGYKPTAFTRTGNITLAPAWSSDGSWLAYTSYYKGRQRLSIKHKGRKKGSYLGGRGIKVDPAWLPGKFELAATLSHQGDPEIYLLTGEGKVIKRLTHSRGIDVSPSWSPDGKQMAFVSRRSGTPQIYIKNMDTGQVRRLTYEGRYNQQPDWSPLGDRITFSGMDKRGINIFTIGTDGTNLTQLTQNGGDNESPSWSPDGTMIAFSSNREGPSRIFVMTAFGTDQRRLLSLDGEQSEPQWSRNLEQ